MIYNALGFSLCGRCVVLFFILRTEWHAHHSLRTQLAPMENLKCLNKNKSKSNTDIT